MIQRAQDAPGRIRRQPPRPGVGLALFGLAAVVRALAALALRPPLAADPRLPVIAGHLVAGSGFATGPAAAPIATASLPPVAPALLALASRVTHGHPLTLAALSILVGALSTVAAARLATGLHGPTAGRTAGLAVALSPLLSAGATLLQPAVFALTLLLALTAAAEWLRTPRRMRAVLTGALVGTCTLAGVPGILLAPVVLAWAWRPLGLTLPPGERLAQSGLLLAGLAAVVVPWSVRSSMALRAPVFVTSSIGSTLRAGSNAELWNDPVRRGGALETTAPATGPVATPPPAAAPATRAAAPAEAAADRHALAEALQFLRSRPATEFLAVTGARAVRLATPAIRPDDPASDRPLGPAALALVALEALWMALAAWGAARTLTGPRRWFQSLPLVALATLAAATLTISGSSRTRLALEPLVALLAGLGALHARRTLHLRRRGLRVVPGARTR